MREKNSQKCLDFYERKLTFVPFFKVKYLYGEPLPIKYEVVEDPEEVVIKKKISTSLGGRRFYLALPITIKIHA